jgi:thiol-disulfide isomerase/thioredoxin
VSSDLALPSIEAAEWLNTEQPLSLAALRGRVVVVEAFQMLCPGCVSHGLPQAQRIAQTFRPDDVAVIGLHCVFEHHEAMTPVALRAFLHEYRIRFPVAVDAPGASAMPRTMAAWQLEGTPTLLLFDRQGQLRARHFGQVADMAIGAEIMALVSEDAAS